MTEVCPDRATARRLAEMIEKRQVPSPWRDGGFRLGMFGQWLSRISREPTSPPDPDADLRAVHVRLWNEFMIAVANLGPSEPMPDYTHWLEARLEAAERLRPEVLAFALLMEERLRANDHKGGWSEMWTSELVERAEEELAELSEAVADGKGRAVIGHEAADVANFVMMVADNEAALARQPGGENG